VSGKGLKYIPILVSVIVLAGGLLAVQLLKDKNVSLQSSGSINAVFAGGCFWGVERAFEGVQGVIDVTSGYTGGHGADPTYEDYAVKGHTEAVRVAFDPSVVTYGQLLDVFWKEIGAACQLKPKSTSYRTAIFYVDADQKAQAEASKEQLEKSGLYPQPVVTEILPLKMFYIAEEYHQDYHRKQNR